MRDGADWRRRLGEARTEAFRFEDDGLVPNSRLPLLLYRGALTLDGAEDPAALFEAAFAANGWSGSWRNGIYDYRHYHSTSHEVLGVARGGARVELGGAKGQILRLGAGDVVVIPAGVGHRCVEADEDFLVFGAYPGGRSWDLLRDTPREHAKALEHIPRVPLPEADPLFGRDGPLVHCWRSDG